MSMRAVDPDELSLKQPETVVIVIVNGGLQMLKMLRTYCWISLRKVRNEVKSRLVWANNSNGTKC
jgi:hypothetical protein